MRRRNGCSGNVARAIMKSEVMFQAPRMMPNPKRIVRSKESSETIRKIHRDGIATCGKYHPHTVVFLSLSGMMAMPRVAETKGSDFIVIRKECAAQCSKLRRRIHKSNNRQPKYQKPKSAI